MTDFLTLYPHCNPYDTGFISKDGHEIYYEQCGNPNGKPAVFLHGGPGGGGSQSVRRFFDPDIYRIVILIKEAVEEVSLMVVLKKILLGI